MAFDRAQQPPLPPAIQQRQEIGLFTRTLTHFAAANVLFFKMRARDSGAVGSVPTYRVWVVTGAPDSTATFYTGTKLGALVDIEVSDAWVAAQ